MAFLISEVSPYGFHREILRMKDTTARDGGGYRLHSLLVRNHILNKLDTFERGFHLLY